MFLTELEISECQSGILDLINGCLARNGGGNGIRARSGANAKGGIRARSGANAKGGIRAEAGQMKREGYGLEVGQM